jgi:hypothetical protein
MSDKVNEIAALAQIDNLLSQLEEEEVSRIFGFISSKYKFIKVASPDPISTNAQTQSIGESFNSNMSIKEFVSIKRPEGYYERIACLGYYLEKVKGLEGFKTADITEANKEARLNPMSNPTFFVNDATSKYGYLTPIGGGNKALSAKGEAVVEALPDRERVKQVLEDNPIKRKNPKKNNKTNKIKE